MVVTDFTNESIPQHVLETGFGGCRVWVVLPSDLQCPAQALRLECVQLSFVGLIETPCFASIEEYGANERPEKRRLGPLV